MAKAVLFMGWDFPARGRANAGLEVGNELMQYYGRLQQEGQIESFGVADFTPRGGLGGFAWLCGTAQQIESVRCSEEFGRLVNHVRLRVNELEINHHSIDEGIAEVITAYDDKQKKVERTRSRRERG